MEGVRDAENGQQGGGLGYKRGTRGNLVSETLHVLMWR